MNIIIEVLLETQSHWKPTHGRLRVSNERYPDVHRILTSIDGASKHAPCNIQVHENKFIQLTFVINSHCFASHRSQAVDRLVDEGYEEVQEMQVSPVNPVLLSANNNTHCLPICKI